MFRWSIRSSNLQLSINGDDDGPSTSAAYYAKPIHDRTRDQIPQQTKAELTIEGIRLLTITIAVGINPIQVPLLSNNTKL